MVPERVRARDLEARHVPERARAADRAERIGVRGALERDRAVGDGLRELARRDLAVAVGVGAVGEERDEEVRDREVVGAVLDLERHGHALPAPEAGHVADDVARVTRGLRALRDLGGLVVVDLDDLLVRPPARRAEARDDLEVQAHRRHTLRRDVDVEAGGGVGVRVVRDLRRVGDAVPLAPVDDVVGADDLVALVVVRGEDLVLVRDREQVAGVLGDVVVAEGVDGGVAGGADELAVVRPEDRVVVLEQDLDALRARDRAVALRVLGEEDPADLPGAAVVVGRDDLEVDGEVAVVLEDGGVEVDLGVVEVALDGREVRAGDRAVGRVEELDRRDLVLDDDLDHARVPVTLEQRSETGRGRWLREQSAS